MKVFISYRRSDSKPASFMIAGGLKSKLGESEVFIDRKNIPGGTEFRKEIKQAISECKVVLAIMGDTWLDVREKDQPARRRLDNPEDLVRLELEMALESGRHINPVLVDEAKVPDKNDLPAKLMGLPDKNAVRFRSEEWELSIAELVAAIEELV
jgi:hypothetical protein